MGGNAQGGQHLRPLPHASCLALQAAPAARTPRMHWWLTQLQPPGGIAHKTPPHPAPGGMG